MMIRQFANLEYPCVFVDCDPGYMYSFNQSDCIPCPKNTYQPMKGQFQCNQCPHGTLTYTDDLHVNITDCEEGTFNDPITTTLHPIQTNPSYIINVPLKGKVFI